MRKIIIFFLIIFTCKEAKFNHPAEGAGGILIGTARPNSLPTILVSSNPDIMEEGSFATLQIKLSRAISGDAKVSIVSNKNFISVTSPSSSELNFTPENYTTNQTVIIKVNSSDKVNPEEATLSFTSGSLSPTQIKIKVNFKFSRKFIFAGDTSVAEEANGNLLVSLSKKPTANVNATITASDSSAVSIVNPVLNFTPENYSTAQTVVFSINDIYNDNRSYTFTVSADGESSISPPVTVIDNDYAYLDISAGQPNNSGISPSLAMDLPNARFYIAATDNSRGNRVLFYRCSLSGSSCNFFYKTSSENTNTGTRPHIVLDSANNRVVTATKDLNTTKVRLSFCDIDFSAACSFSTMTGNFSYSYENPKLLFPSSTSLVVAGGVSTAAYMAACSSNGTGCIEPATNPIAIVGGYGSRAAVIDTVNSKIITAYNGDYPIPPTTPTSHFIPIVLSFNYDGTGAQNFVISHNDKSGITPDLKIDSVNSKLILATANSNGTNSKPLLFICDLNVSGCIEKDISTGQLFTFFFPSLNIDSTNKKILVVVHNGNQSNAPYLFHCDQNGDNCKSTDLSRGSLVSITSDSLAPNYDSAIDSINKRLILVFTDQSTGKLKMLRFGLGGF